MNLSKEPEDEELEFYNSSGQLIPARMQEENIYAVRVGFIVVSPGLWFRVTISDQSLIAMAHSCMAMCLNVKFRFEQRITTIRYQQLQSRYRLVREPLSYGPWSCIALLTFHAIQYSMLLGTVLGKHISRTYIRPRDPTICFKTYIFPGDRHSPSPLQKTKATEGKCWRCKQKTLTVFFFHQYPVCIECGYHIQCLVDIRNIMQAFRDTTYAPDSLQRRLQPYL